MQHFVCPCANILNIFLSEKLSILFLPVFRTDVSVPSLVKDHTSGAAPACSSNNQGSYSCAAPMFWTERKFSSNFAKVWCLHVQIGQTVASFNMFPHMSLFTQSTFLSITWARDHSWRPKHNAKKSLKETSIWPAISRSINIIGWGVEVEGVDWLKKQEV